MVIAIEVIYMQGNYDLHHDNKDGWTIRTKDGKISAVFEETVVVSYRGPQVLTPLTPPAGD
jgi:methionyl aminopeptidase